MSVNTPVFDRIPTHPGRVTLIPVTGQTNTYDMVRADSPTQEGTPINKSLLDQKAYTLVQDTTVYVSTLGNDETGEGTVAKPYKTIQKAINDLPKNLGGYIATINIATGTYPERLAINGFANGRLYVGVAGVPVTVRGISIHGSRHVHLNISNITWPGGTTLDLLYAGYGSNVSINTDLTINGGEATSTAIGAADGSFVSAQGVTISINNMVGTNIYATSGARMVFGTVTGGENTGYRIRSFNGGIITYSSISLAANKGDLTSTGGRILTGAGTSLANASIV